MQANRYDIYAEFLIACRKAMGPMDIEKLAFDIDYQFEFFNRVLAGANDDILDIADLISRELNTVKH